MSVNLNNDFQNYYLNFDNKITVPTSKTLYADSSSLHPYEKRVASTEVLKQSLPISEKIDNHSNYRFPENFSLNVNEHVYDLSNITIDLSKILIGGIARGAIASQLMANGMHAIGHGGGVYNLPFCIENDYSGDLTFVSKENKLCKKEEIKNIIESAIDKGFYLINIPMDVKYHASLASLELTGNEASLRFYDSLSPKEFNYADRYTDELIIFIQSLLPEVIHLKQDHEILHLLHQGDGQSTGCGYYTLYTASLLKDRDDFKQLSNNSQQQELIFRPEDDSRIRAEVALRTLLFYGMENAKREIRQLRFFGKIEHVFQQLGADSLDNLIDSIYKKNNPFLFKFPDNFKITIKGKTIDIGCLEVDLANCAIGGIGCYGASASQLLANGMNAIESSYDVFNFPICIEGLLDVPKEHQGLQLISTSNAVMEIDEVRAKIDQAILSGYTSLNIPLNIDGHASLACITISKEKAFLKFYESQEKIRHDTRYTPILVGFIETILPNTLRLKKSFEVIPLLRQRNFSGGYYTLYTAYMLKERKETRSLSATDMSLPLLNEVHEKQIQAELVIRTLLTYGIQEAKETVGNVQLYGKVEHIFQKLGTSYLTICKELDKQIKVTEVKEQTNQPA